MICVRKIREAFPIYKNHPQLVYLDSAASALKLNKVKESINYYYDNLNTNVYRGDYDLGYQTTTLFEATREEVAQFINADKQEIVFTKGTTEGINLVANHFSSILKEGDEIIISELEHHTNFIPWQIVAKKTKATIKYVKLTKEGRITVANFLAVLSDKTKIVALNYVSNVMGYLTPLREIIMLAHEKKARVLIDAAQAAPHFKLDVKALKVDYLAFSSHKMFGPTGVGILYLNEQTHQETIPFEYGGEMVLKVDKESAIFKDAPYKFEAGTPPIEGVIAFKEAIKFFNKIDYSSIREHTKMLHEYTLKKLKELKEVKVYNPHNEIGLITFNIDGVHPHDAMTIFAKNKVYLRAGQHCAEPITKFLGEMATLRASFHIYNDFNDCDKLVASIKETIAFFKQFRGEKK